MANKFTNYLLFMAGLTLTFYFLGLIDGGLTDTFIDILLNFESMQSSSKMLIFTGLAVGVLGVAFGSSILGFSADLVVFGVAVAPLLGFGWDFLVVINTVASVSRMFAIMVFAPLMFLWVLTALEWWRGVTN